MVLLRVFAFRVFVFLFSSSGGGKIGGFSPFFEAAAPKGMRMKFAHDFDLRLGRDLIFQTDGPVAGIHQEPAKSFALEILRRSHGGRENPAPLTPPPLPRGERAG